MPTSSPQTISSSHCCDEPLETALALIELQRCSVAELRQAHQERVRRRPSLDRLAVANGRLSIAHASRVWQQHAIDGGCFLDVAISLGLLDETAGWQLLRERRSTTPSLAEVATGLGLITVDELDRLLIRHDI